VEFTERVRDGLEILRRRDPAGKRVFGAASHRYELHPPLDQSAVARFEAAHSVQLPSDYRAFLTQIGNGGAGPYYGVFKLGEMDDGYGDKPWKPGLMVGVPSQSFPHRERWNLSEAELERIQASEDDDEIIRTYWRPVDGALPICHQGCALRDWLAVTGPEAGHVWHDATADFQGWRPWTRNDGRHMTFAEWYVAWLEKALSQTAN